MSTQRTYQQSDCEKTSRIGSRLLILPVTQRMPTLRLARLLHQHPKTSLRPHSCRSLRNLLNFRRLFVICDVTCSAPAPVIEHVSDDTYAAPLDTSHRQTLLRTVRNLLLVWCARVDTEHRGFSFCAGTGADRGHSCSSNWLTIQSRNKSLSGSRSRLGLNGLRSRAGFSCFYRGRYSRDTRH